MIYAVIISLIIHLITFTIIIFGGSPGQEKAYPRIMSVNLVSMPPIAKGVSSGTETPGQPRTNKTESRKQSRVKQKPSTPHVAEVEKKKRPTRKKPKPKTKAEIEDNKKKPSDKSQPGIDDDKFGLPEGVEFGSEFGTVQLDGATFETPTYLNILFAKIKYRWDNPYLGAEKISCIIYFSILRNGDVVDAIVEKSSGISAFDQSALRAVFSSKPPPLPLEYTGNQLGIHLEFQFLP